MYLRTIFNETKSQIENIQSMINNIKADVIAENRTKGCEGVEWPVYLSIYSMLSSDQIAKIERLGSAIGMNAHDMISFLTLKSYDFKYYLSLVK
jgi:uncharacterized protein involved in high-affinity Fe2+ transport